MTYEEAKRILHPDTTREALADIWFKGKEKSQEAVDEACLKAWDGVKAWAAMPKYRAVTAMHKPCYGKCPRCVWLRNGGCSEWQD